MADLASELNKEISGAEATIRLTNGESFRMIGNVENVADNFIKIGLSKQPGQKRPHAGEFQSDRQHRLVREVTHLTR